MRAIVSFVLLTALRDRLFAVLGLLTLVIGVLSLFLGDAALVEKRETAMALAAAAIRVLLALGLFTFIGFHVQRLYDTREIEMLLTRPISRERFTLALGLGYASVAALLGAAGGLVPFVYGAEADGAAAFAVSLVLECCIVALFAMFCGLGLQRAVPTVLVGAAFYVFARSMGFFTAIADAKRASLLGAVPDWVLDGVLYAVATVMPRLDLFAQTRWLVHGLADDGTWRVVVLQGTVYLPLLLAAAMFDMRRKRF